MGVWKKAIQLLKDAHASAIHDLTVKHYRELLNEWKHECDAQVAEALRVRNAAVKDYRDLETRCLRLTSWMKHTGTGSVCLGQIDRMDEYGEVSPQFEIALVHNTNEFKFVRDMLEDGPEGHATSTRGVHPAKRWNIKDWTYKTSLSQPEGFCDE